MGRTKARRAVAFGLVCVCIRCGTSSTQDDAGADAGNADVVTNVDASSDVVAADATDAADASDSGAWCRVLNHGDTSSVSSGQLVIDSNTIAVLERGATEQLESFDRLSGDSTGIVTLSPNPPAAFGSGFASRSGSAYSEIFENPANVYAIPLDGGARTPLGDGGVPGVGGVLALDTTTVYFANEVNLNVSGALFAVPVDAGAVTVISNALAVPVGPFVVDATHAFMLAGQPAQLWAIALSGDAGAPVSLATTTVPSPPIADARIVADATKVYWIDGSNRIVSVDKTGGTPSAIYASAGAYGLAIDGSNLFWTNPGRVMRGTVTGTTATPVVMIGGSPVGGSLVIDTSGIAWVTQDNAVCYAPR